MKIIRNKLTDYQINPQKSNEFQRNGLFFIYKLLEKNYKLSSLLKISLRSEFRF